MSESKKEKKAKDIKSSIISGCRYIQEKDIKITHDISRYTPGTNRNASSGEVAVWVLVEVPEIPQIESDSYYQKNPHLKKPSEEGVEKIKERVKMIESSCQTAANIHGAEYCGRASDYEGYGSSTTKTTYLNIRVV